MKKITLDDYADTTAHCYALADKLNELIKLVEEKFTSHNKQMVAALWAAICSDSVKKIGYDAQESEWVPLNIERLNAAWEKVMQ